MSNPAPRIGISSTIPGLGEYGAAIERCGGTAVAFSFDATTLAAQLDGIDGVVLSGGGDVDPARYGTSSPLVEGVDDVRDTFETALLLEARRRGLATLCICRGMQLANVVFGGTLVVDLADAFGLASGIRHQRRDAAGKVMRGVLEDHPVNVKPGCALASIVQSEQILTGSRHHQSLDRAAGDLRVVARCTDGTIEAVEARFASPFWVGVQWHPESTLDLDRGESEKLFRAFVRAAAGVVTARP